MRNQGGFTLLELVVGMSILSIFGLIISNYYINTTKLVNRDTAQVVNIQNTQGAFSILTADLRQAGENLDTALGISGISFDNSVPTVTVRRMIPALTSKQTSVVDLIGQTVKTMPLCSINGNSIEIVGPPLGQTVAAAGCAFNPSGVDGEDVNVRPWRAYFTSQGNIPQIAILVRPATGSQTAKIDRITVKSIQPTTTTGTGVAAVSRTYIDLATSVPADYTASNGSTITLIDERRYFLDSSKKQLKLALGGQTDDEASVLAFNISAMSISAKVASSVAGGSDTTPSTFGLTDPWTRIKSVTVSLTGKSENTLVNGNKTLTSTIFPRNVESGQ